MTHKKGFVSTLATTVSVVLLGISRGLKRPSRGSPRANNPSSTQWSCTLRAIFLPEQYNMRDAEVKEVSLHKKRFASFINVV